MKRKATDAPTQSSCAPHELWTVAASVLAKVLRGGSLKSLLAPMDSGRARPVNALVTETLKKRRVLERFVDTCGPWRTHHSDRDEPHVEELRLLLAHEALFGRGLRQPPLLRGATRSAALAEALERMRRWESSMLKSERAAGRTPKSLDAPTATVEDAALALPRYVRVNTLKASVEEVVATLRCEGWRLVSAPTSPATAASATGTGGTGLAAGAAIVVSRAPPEPPCFWQDPHVPSLLVLPPHAELHAHALVASSVLILQDKASCLAPAALAPRPGELILDCCAAPGNKTTQLAALAAPGGRVLACERDVRRAAVLERRAAEAAGSAITVLQTDFMSIDPTAAPYSQVTAVQLDPTCSGSGMVERAGFQIGLAAEAMEASHATGQGAGLRALGCMQLELLLHALSFPSARVVVYSTCSVHPIENELVVRAALRKDTVRDAGWQLAPALPAWPCRGLPLLPGAEHLVRAGPEVATNGFFVARFERGETAAARPE